MSGSSWADDYIRGYLEAMDGTRDLDENSSDGYSHGFREALNKMNGVP